MNIPFTFLHFGSEFLSLTQPIRRHRASLSRLPLSVRRRRRSRAEGEVRDERGTREDTNRTEVSEEGDTTRATGNIIIKTTYDISLDFQDSLLPLGFFSLGSVRGGFPCHTASLTSRPYLSTLPILLRHPASGRRGTRGDDGRMGERVDMRGERSS